MSAKTRTRPSYAWARRLEEPDCAGYLDDRRQRIRGATDEWWSMVLRGIEAAQEFAANADERRTRNLLTEFERLGLPVSEKPQGARLRQMEADAAYARRVLFGNIRGGKVHEIGDRAIRHRLQRFAEINGREPRYCEVTGCTNELPRRSRTTRKRCNACRAANRRST